MIKIHCDGYGCDKAELVTPGHRSEFICVKDLPDTAQAPRERHFCCALCACCAFAPHSLQSNELQRIVDRGPLA